MISVRVLVSSLPGNILRCSKDKGETSLDVRERVVRAREYAIKRSGKINADLGSKEIEKFCMLSTKDQIFLENIIEKFKLSTRSYHRILKISRTIADLAGSARVGVVHVSEAIQYRNLDRQSV